MKTSKDILESFSKYVPEELPDECRTAPANDPSRPHSGASQAPQTTDGFRPQTAGGQQDEFESEILRDQNLDTLDTSQHLEGIPPDLARRLASDPHFYIQSLFQIRDKRGDIIPFTYNPTQHLLIQARRKALSQGREAKFLVHKYRRGGITTLIQAETLQRVCTREGQECVTMADTEVKARKIFRMVSLMFDSIPAPLRPFRQHENRKEINLPKQRSSFSIGMAGALAFGRGDTLQRVHGSEVAFWIPSRPQEYLENLMAGLEEATSHGEVILESTANGASGWWYDTVMEAHAGNSEWNLIFLPWFLDHTLQKPINKEQVTEIIDTLTDRERWLVEQHSVNPSQIAWRRAKRQQRTMRRLFPQEYPETVEEAFLSLSLCFFDYSVLVELGTQTQDPIISRGNGREVIVKEPHPDHKYVMGIDPAEGVPEGDPSFAGILDATTGEQVAWLHGNIRVPEFASMCVRLATKYNTALIICERENHGHYFLGELTRAHRYSPLYYSREWDRQTNTRSRRKIGWSTNKNTRNPLLDDLRDAMNEGEMLVNDRAFLTECRTFELSRRNRYEARSGYHDDRIMGWAIALQGIIEGPPNVGVHVL